LDGGHSNTCTVTVSQPGQPYVIAPNGEITFIVLHNYYVAPSGHVLVVPKGSVLNIVLSDDITWTADSGMIIEVDLRNLGASSFTFKAENEDADIIIASKVHLDPHKKLTVIADGDINISDTKITAGDTVYLKAGGTIFADKVLLTTSGGNADMDLIAGQNIYVQSAHIDSKNGDLSFTAGDTIYTIYVTSATLKDKNNTAKASPVDVKIIGVPASGAINYSG
ncbi:MAG: hypothetical protein RDU41_02885, partial [Clostridia bacterium]|nr:hypothetical protein [Clostridia bacterium]